MRNLTTDTYFQESAPAVQTSQTAATENLPATPLVYIAYGGIWLLLLLYVFMLWRKLQRIEKDLQQLPTARPASDRR